MKVFWLTAWSTLGWIVGFWLGSIDGFLIALCVFMLTDYLTGVANAIKTKTVSSAVGFSGLIKKVAILALVGIGHMLDKYVLGDGSGVRSMIIFFYLANEGISILENAVLLGLKVPDKLKNILENLEGGNNENK